MKDICAFNEFSFAKVFRLKFPHQETQISYGQNVAVTKTFLVSFERDRIFVSEETFRTDRDRRNRNCRARVMQRIPILGRQLVSSSRRLLMARAALSSEVSSLVVGFWLQMIYSCRQAHRRRATSPRCWRRKRCPMRASYTLTCLISPCSASDVVCCHFLLCKTNVSFLQRLISISCCCAAVWPRARRLSIRRRFHWRSSRWQ